MHPYVAHLRNKYPHGHVDFREDSIDAFDAKGVHRVALRKNGAGQMVDVSKDLGLSDVFCLAPIPKEARVHKFKDGKMGLDELAEERMPHALKLAENDGRVPSIKEIEDAKAKA